MSWWTAIFGEPADWRLVKEIQAGYIAYRLDPHDADKHLGESKEEVTYYLYENQYGERKFDAVDSRDGDINVDSDAAKRTWTYRSQEYRYTIRPWLDGRLDPEIPTYESMPRRDFKRALDGKK